MGIDIFLEFSVTSSVKWAEPVTPLFPFTASYLLSGVARNEGYKGLIEISEGPWDRLSEIGQL